MNSKTVGILSYYHYLACHKVILIDFVSRLILKDHLFVRNNDLPRGNILAKENNFWKRRPKEEYSITKHKDKAPLLNKKNECPTISNIWKPIL